MFKVSNRNTRGRCEICTKLITKTRERRYWRCSGVFIVNFIHSVSSVSVVSFEQVNNDWDDREWLIQRRIQNLVKHLRCFHKTLHIRRFTGFLNTHLDFPVKKSQENMK